MFQFFPKWQRFLLILSGFAFFASLFAFILSNYKVGRLPDPKDICSQLYLPPIQIEVPEKRITVRWGKTRYVLVLLYKYKLYGMIVSIHNSRDFHDLYHRLWGDFLNFADVCVIWGDNLKPQVYNSIKNKKIRFYQSSVNCYTQWNNCLKCFNFRPDCFSNNHLLSNDPRLRKKVLSLDIGDQIMIKGYLCSYMPENGSYLRNTSVVRNDIGSGACEIIWVEDVKLLRMANPYWRKIRYVSRTVLFYTAVITGILAFL